MTDNTRRVVVTGLGIVSPVGSSIDKAWGNIKNGVSGIRRLVLLTLLLSLCRYLGPLLTLMQMIT